MRQVPATILLFLLAAAAERGATGATTFDAAPRTQEPVATRQNVFFIPFQVNRVERPAAQPVEVRLYVSGDRGVSWVLYSRQHPSVGKFHFRAGRDGEYWFTTQTVDRENRTRPDRPTRPALRVVVDTTVPKLDVRASVGAAGEIKTDWYIFDEHLSPDSFRLQYQPGPSQRWQPVAVELPRDQTTRMAMSGTAAWSPRTRAQVINVRAEVRDRAGNSTMVNRRLELPRIAASAPAPNRSTAPPRSDWEAAPSSAPVMTAAGTPRGDGTVRWPAVPTTEVAVGPANRFGPAPRRPPKGPVRGRWSDDEPIASAGYHNAAGPSARSTGVRGDPHTAPNNRSDGRGFEPGGFRRNPLPQHSADTRSRASGDFDPRMLPRGVRPWMSNSLRLDVPYQIASNGPAAAGDVELWSTRDGGRTWTSCGTDPDGRSPFPVRLDGEGLYGFRVVAHGGPGRPRAGYEPSIWFTVDLTKPTARIISARYGDRNRHDMLDIRWQAYDRYLHEAPVTLLVSDKPDGPWSPIAEGLPNTGQYTWTVDGRAPRQFFLRLVVCDQAGNVAIDQSQRLLRSAGIVPIERRQLRGLSPLVGAQARPRRWR